jgi:hypothetical protein
MTPVAMPADFAAAMRFTLGGVAMGIVKIALVSMPRMWASYAHSRRFLWEMSGAEKVLSDRPFRPMGDRWSGGGDIARDCDDGFPDALTMSALTRRRAMPIK